MYRVTTIERDDDGELYCLLNIIGDSLSEAVRYINRNGYYPGRRTVFGAIIVETIIEGEPT